MEKNLITNTDSYKWGMFLQYPEKTETVYSYIESRGSEEDELVFFGLRYYIEEYLSKPITEKNIEHYVKLAKGHGDPSNEEGWRYILEKYDGYMPVTIKALPEGTIVNGKVVMAVIYNNDPKCYWLTTHIETSLLRAIWYPTTVATNSREIKKIIKQNLEETGDVGGLKYKLHDFGARGAHTYESSGIGGAAHLVNFFGSDTLAASDFLIYYYDADYDVGGSIPATEHSISTSFGPDKEVEYVTNHIDKCVENGYMIFSVVGDTYNIYNFVNMIGTRLKEKIFSFGAAGGTIVIRPDSGDATVVPIEVIELLMEHFGFVWNVKGYKVLPPFLRVIQGDGIDKNTIMAIYESMKAKKMSGDNIAFGMGGKLLGAPQRDDYKFAMKASNVTIDSVGFPIAKDPITDKGKKSKKGKFSVVRKNGKLVTIPENGVIADDLLEIVYVNGIVFRRDNIKEIRERADLK